MYSVIALPPPTTWRADSGAGSNRIACPLKCGWALVLARAAPLLCAVDSRLSACRGPFQARSPIPTKIAGDKQNNDQCTTLRATRVQQATTVCDNKYVTCVLCQTVCFFRLVLEFKGAWTAQCTSCLDAIQQKI
ncbi:unnamed protein product [Arctia plantaginis]|uniref:Uncharacterized protein n=1 Tax=Arctia plantaginis TaxID=874455 RepID=A0A8S0ZKF8_ARCPL|nr:unnamed protein product [Arctia plantaginis]CAB3242687.1 unnamed protein product [Arctia plantaginis]